MKSALEIIDNFTDDFFSGIIEVSVDDASKRINKEFWTKMVTDMGKFIIEITQYRKITNNDDRSIKAESLMEAYATLKVAGFFKFVDSSVMALKLENVHLRGDNKDLAKELRWYKENYPDVRASSGVAQDV